LPRGPRTGARSARLGSCASPRTAEVCARRSARPDSRSRPPARRPT
jgi:hypothetical protein